MQPLARNASLAALLLASSTAVFLMAAAPQTTRPAQEESWRTQKPAPPPPFLTATPLPPVAPITFEDPDGQALILEEVTARTAIHGMLSLTELDLRFRNPKPERMEGRFTCTLPANAAISRFAKDVNGQLMEGEVVERLRANQVYEQFLHQMRDPALLEQEQGNRFSARVFPIEANAPVRILLSYTALLPMKDGVRTYSLPLRGLPKVKKLTFRGFVTPVPGEGQKGTITTSSAQVTSFDETDWTPDRDIVMSWTADAHAPAARVLRAGDFYLAAYRPTQLASSSAASSSRWLLYVDTSASSAEGSAHRIRAIESLLGGLPPGDDVQVVAFDQEVVPLANGDAASVARVVGEKLRARLFLGGTDLGAVLRDLSSRRKKDPGRTAVFASDLVPTLGATASHEVTTAIAGLPAGAPIHALILGSREDAPTARALTQGRGRIVRVPFSEQLPLHARNASEALRRPLGASLELRDASAEWIYPTRFEDVQPGDEILALAKLKPGSEPAPSLGGAVPVRLDNATFAPLLQREAYRAYLQYLAEREAGETTDAVRRALATEQVRVSIEQRVVIPRTTMLVLENEFEYQRFGLDRRALAAILTIDAGGIGRIDRTNREITPVFADRSVPPPPVANNPRFRKQAPMSAENRREEPAMSEAITVTAQAPAMGGSAREQDAGAQFAFDAFEEVGVETTVTGGVEGGVAGGVPGGVVGGVVGGIVVDRAASDAAPPPARVASPVPTVTTSGPIVAPPPPPPPPPPAPREERKQQRDWTKVSRPSRSRIAELEKEVAANPKDRELYNQLGEVLAAHAEWSSLRKLALRWQPYDPENPQVYELLGLADQRLGNDREAARAYASLIEIAPAKTELLQRAGLLLLGIGQARLAETPLRRALEVRPDRANGYRHLALMLWSEDRHEEAARVLESATRQTFPNWYLDVQRVVREELGYVYRSWMKKDASRRAEIEDRAREYAVDLDRNDALRVTLAWETDANDVDLHVVDPSGEEAFYSHQRTASGLELYADVRQGLGPEVIRTPKVQRGTYHVGVRYFAAGPMGISRGVVIVMRGDDIEVHPFRLQKGGEEIRYVAAVSNKG